MVERFLATMERTRDLDLHALRVWARRLLSELALQDWIVLSYLIVMFSAVGIFGQPGPVKTQNLERIGALIAAVAIVLVAVRGAILTRPLASSILYRVTIYGAVQASYFLLRPILPLVSDRAYDTQLYQIDLRLFGFEPTLLMDRFVNSYSTEWFAFFYYGYFFVLALHILPFLFLSRRLKLFAEFALGLFSVYCIAHLTYMLVPGYGPYRYLAGEFHHPLVSGFWLERVLEAVNNAGAQKDIFPSLHTAGPAFILFFSFRHRDKFPFRYTWPVVGFFVANIVTATMFLRWHYLIDVVAGVTLAFSACFVAARVSRWEVGLRASKGLQPVWMRLWPERSPELLPSPELHSARH